MGVIEYAHECTSLQRNTELAYNKTPTGMAVHCMAGIERKAYYIIIQLKACSAQQYNVAHTVESCAQETLKK